VFKIFIILLFSFNAQAKISFNKLYTSDGKLFSEKEMNSEVKVASFFFSSCAHTCLLINAKLKVIHEKLTKKKNIQILSITVDPKYDSIKVLSKYAKKWRDNSKQWKFVTGDSEEIFSVIKNQFKLPGGGMAFVHSESVIVYKNGKSIGTFSLFNKSELKKLHALLGI
jgi:protein SCO1/2